MAFYDREGSGGLSSRISSDIPKIQEAIGDKLGGFLQYVPPDPSDASLNPPSVLILLALLTSVCP